MKSRFNLIIFTKLILLISSINLYSSDLGLDGRWLLEINSRDIGIVKTIFNFEVKDSSFFGYTREGVDREVLGFWKSLLGRIFTDDFENGSLIRIVDGNFYIKNDTLKMKAIFRSAIGSYYFIGSIVNGEMNVRLINGRGVLKGEIKGSKSSIKTPLSDYHQIVKKSFEISLDKIYNPDIIKSEKWECFRENILDYAGKAQDDVEFVFAHFYFARNIGFTHYALMKSAYENKILSIRDTSHYMYLSEKTPETAYLKIISFSGTSLEVDSIFEIINYKIYKNLIIDLCDNTGGTVESGMRLASYLTDSVFYGGVFLTQKWFLKNDRLPKVSEYENLPHFTESNYGLILNGIHEQEGLCIKVIPNENHFKGNVFVLVNSATASTCEPIVYGLKQYKLAQIIGEKTAGAMLNGEMFEIQDNFSLIIPTADYYTSDGYRIDRNGVEPDIEIEPENALDYVLNNLIK